ncbi:competence protein [Mesorhizobium sp. Root157]|uniref:ComEC/Rec2 family competence protein n=1 Tax=Mesorhizobium sp. Root157 TaxID=1736477 RepID=UPI0006F60220|nr:ComEC/Rec2 family competence protein [Mesorhizobium sp. Root157]KQZ99648.1 competence protein [Mesorhizobium sp. Root157]
MAGSARGEKDVASALSEVSERSFFASPPLARLPSIPVERSPVASEPVAVPAESIELNAHRQPVRRFGRLRALTLSGLRADATKAVATELDRGAAFLLVPVLLAVGAIVYFSLDAEPDWRALLAATVALAVLTWGVRSRHAAFLCVAAMLLCSVGMLAGKVETWRASTAMLGSEVSTRLTGQVVSIDDMANGRVRLTLDVVSTERPTLRYQPERVRLSARKVPQGLTAGSTITGLVRLLPPTGPVRPDSYDYSFESYFDGIGASGFFLSGPQASAPAPMSLASRITAAIERARDGIADHVRETVGGPEGEIAAALIVGVRAGIPETINEAMRKTGIYHIISISGLHMALVAGTVMALMRGAFALFPGFASRRPTKKYAAAAALFAIAAYLLISGAVVAAERSFIMLAVMLAAVLFDRAALTMRNLAISAIVVIALSPHEVVGPSFQLSFAATAALIGAYAGWGDYRASRQAAAYTRGRSWPGTLLHRFAVMMAGLAATSIIAGGATALFAIWHFQRVAPLSLFANLAVMPIVSILVMPFAVFASLLMPVGLDGPFLYVMGKGLSAMIAMSAWIATLSPLDAVGLVSASSVVLMTIALVIATMTTTWLRLAAIPVAAAGLLTVAQVQTPDVLISEDARLVATPVGGGRLAVNRSRPNAFTIDNWLRALDAETIAKPDPKAFKTAPERLEVVGPPGTPFRCTDDLCVARHISGKVVAQAKSAIAARPACAFADVVVIDDATASDPCRRASIVVITKRQLARSGSAAVFFAPGAAGSVPQVRFAVEKDYRPWHVQRQFSREARGMEPYKRKGRSIPISPEPGPLAGG